MTFLLSSENVCDYLIGRGLSSLEEREVAKISAKEYKNFNLLVRLGNRSLLVKQERHDTKGNNRNDLWTEWRIYEFSQYFCELRNLCTLTSEIIHFDPENSILVLNYFENYCDFSDFYDDHQNQFFPAEIAASIGTAIATIHKSTLDCQRYKDFLTQSRANSPSIKTRTPNFLRGLEQVGPGLFSRISTDGLAFWQLYQRYESLHHSIVDICKGFDPCCVTHNDLVLRNILLNLSWDVPTTQGQKSDPIVRLIDWEFLSWGDPAYDLGMLLSGYLKIWLRSLVVSDAIDIQMALRLATTPLEKLQPSMVAVLDSYLTHFPEILERYPNFLNRVMQFIGLVLIKRIQSKLEQLDSFDNTSICTLQVAKMLVCNPEQSILYVLGIAGAKRLAKQPIPV